MTGHPNAPGPQGAAHPPESEIGQAISELNEVAEGRSWIRFSGRTGPITWASYSWSTEGCHGST